MHCTERVLICCQFERKAPDRVYNCRTDQTLLPEVLLEGAKKDTLGDDGEEKSTTVLGSHAGGGSCRGDGRAAGN